ncbi:hypothetical protein [Limimaricola cinnabarinus]|uniref:hypothetical protein n=1 Tax=Limimaricola cinnabarinus TaxID=1125964 RepID=UPI0013A60543|nr:hypothetical protein [Limimaricola cinnabarinus]
MSEPSSASDLLTKSVLRGQQGIGLVGAVSQAVQEHPGIEIDPVEHHLAGAVLVLSDDLVDTVTAQQVLPSIEALRRRVELGVGQGSHRLCRAFLGIAVLAGIVEHDLPPADRSDLGPVEIGIAIDPGSGGKELHAGHNGAS